MAATTPVRIRDTAREGFLGLVGYDDRLTRGRSPVQFREEVSFLIAHLLFVVWVRVPKSQTILFDFCSEDLRKLVCKVVMCRDSLRYCNIGVTRNVDVVNQQPTFLIKK